MDPKGPSAEGQQLVTILASQVTGKFRIEDQSKQPSTMVVTRTHSVGSMKKTAKIHVLITSFFFFL